MFDSKQFLGELPAFISIVLEKITSFPGLKKCTTRLVDQLTGRVYFLSLTTIGVWLGLALS